MGRTVCQYIYIYIICVLEGCHCSSCCWISRTNAVMNLLALFQVYTEYRSRLAQDATSSRQKNVSQHNPPVKLILLSKGV